MSDGLEVVEMEYSEDDILYYLVDEDDIEVGFVIMEDGQEIECYYEEYEEFAFEPVEEPKDNSSSSKKVTVQVDDDEDDEDEEEVEHGYIYKIASIASHEGGKVRKKAEKQLDKMRDKAEVQVKKAGKAASVKAKEAKEKADGFDLGITREDVSEMTSDLNALAKEGAATAKELKEAYDDIMDDIGFLIPKGKGRRR